MPASQTIEPIDLAQAARERYLRYAMSVITARALPDVRDGLKPVQRRILYAMNVDLGLGPNSRFMKSAKVVGKVIGDYHPHGDSAIYEAMVRMAQPFSLRYPLVDGQGNFGAITGDGAAAFRYTEARLRALGADLMETIKEDTVAFLPTFDEVGREPEVLPVPVPLLLLNGATGIAVGMATNIPPHNLREVVKATIALIEKPEASVAQLMRSFKGPDFPTGGELLATKDELREIYEKGAGGVKLRGTWRLEETKAERQRVARRHIVIDSIPYGTSTNQVLAKIKELVDGKKLPQVAHVSDQSSEDDGVRIVLELRSDAAEGDPDLIMAAIYRLTPLETTFGINLTCLFPTARAGVGRPERHCDLKAILRAWLDFRFATVTRSLEFRKKKLEERIHILRGFQVVLSKLDQAIKLVRAAKDRADARAKLCRKLGLDEEQANAVLDIQLYRLAQLEQQKILDELAEKEKEVKRLAKLLAADRPRWDLIKQELGQYEQRYGDARRTKLVADGDEAPAFDPSALLQKEDTHVVVSAQGRLKRIRKLDDVSKVRLREGDELLAVAQGSTLAPVAFFTNFGSAYVMRIHDVPATAGFGDPIQKFFSFKDKERVVGVLGLDPRLLGSSPPGLVVATAKGHAVRAPLEPHLEPSTRAGRKFVKLDGEDEVVGVAVPPAKTRKADRVLLATSKGEALAFPLDQLPEVSGVGKGKRVIKLKKGAQVVGLSLHGELRVESTRGGERVVSTGDVKVGAAGDPGTEVFRFGFKRALPPPPELIELPAEGGE